MGLIEAGALSTFAAFKTGPGRTGGKRERPTAQALRDLASGAKRVLRTTNLHGLSSRREGSMSISGEALEGCRRD